MPPKKPLPISSELMPEALQNTLPHDETANRVIGTTYTNNNDKSIIVVVSVALSLSASGDQASVNAMCDDIDGQTNELDAAESTITVAGLSASVMSQNLVFIVPPLFKYTLLRGDSGTGVTTINSWIEYY